MFGPAAVPIAGYTGFNQLLMGATVRRMIRNAPHAWLIGFVLFNGMFSKRALVEINTNAFNFLYLFVLIALMVSKLIK